ncbi:hypothetical protein R6Z07M_009208 [Ovis aries]
MKILKTCNTSDWTFQNKLNLCIISEKATARVLEWVAIALAGLKTLNDLKPGQSKEKHRNKHQFSSVPQSCLTLCNPMNRSSPGLPVHHQLPESTQTHFHRVDDAIQPSHRLSSPSPPALNLSQHQGLFQ